MISTRRQVNTYRDHFGVYAEQDRPETTVEDFAAPVAEQPATQPVAAMRETPMVMVDASYSTIEDMIAAPAAPAMPEIAEPFEQTSTVAVPKREKREKNKLNTDIKPSKKTQDSLKNAPAASQSATPARRSRTKIDPRTKVMLLVYVVVALVLAVAVIATGVSITNSSAQTQSLYDEIATVQSNISAQEAQIAEITETMHDRATEIGMVDSGSVSGTVSGIDKVDYPDPTVHTNAFDKFCEFISNLIH